MNIQKAHENDLDSWITLRRALWPASTVAALRDEAVSILASPDEACLLLLDNAGTAVGFAEVAIHQGPAGPYGHLEGWYTAPEYRGKGLGRKLIDGIEQWCLHRTICMLTSDTTPDYPLSPGAHERAGFKKIHEFTIFMKVLRPSVGSDGEDAAAELQS